MMMLLCINVHCGEEDLYMGLQHHSSLLFLADFFRGAFDGSGADNFYDAGSCIDGRLTSAWNCKISLSFSLFLLQIL